MHLRVPQQVKITLVNAKEYTFKINTAKILPLTCTADLTISIEESNRIKHGISIYFNSYILYVVNS